MKLSKVLSIAIGTLILGSGALFAQTATQAEPKKEARTAAPQLERETPEMKAERAKNYQFRVDMINLMVRNGKLDRAHGDYLIRRLHNEKTFKDNYPEWVKYDKMARGPGGFVPGGFERGGRMSGMAPGSKKQGPWMKSNQGKGKKGADCDKQKKGK